MKALKIFVVDDDPEFSEGIALTLEIAGYRVETAASGEEAVRKFREQDFDLTFMDIRMPGMSGVESFFEIRKIKPHARVVMMTAYSVEHLINEALEGGALGVLDKPIAVGTLLRKIDEVKPVGVILLADDDPDFAEGIYNELSSAGYSVMIARDGQEAIDKLASNHVDVLLLDLRMPVLSGFEVYLEIKRRGLARPTVIVTGYADQEAETIGALRELSVTGCLTKPIDSAALLDVVESLVEE